MWRPPCRLPWVGRCRVVLSLLLDELLRGTSEAIGIKGRGTLSWIKPATGGKRTIGKRIITIRRERRAKGGEACVY